MSHNARKETYNGSLRLYRLLFEKPNEITLLQCITNYYLNGLLGQSREVSLIIQGGRYLCNSLSRNTKVQTTSRKHNVVFICYFTIVMQVGHRK